MVRRIFQIGILAMTAPIVAGELELQISAPGAWVIGSDARLLVALSKDTEEEPRFSIGWPVARTQATPFFGMDIENWDGSSVSFTPSAGYPYPEFITLPDGVWNLQIVLDQNPVLSDVNAPGNLYSEPLPIRIGSEPTRLRVELTERVPDETLPEDQGPLRFVKMRSDALSQFYATDIYLRAAVLLPASYREGSADTYPVLFHIGGLNARYDRALELWGNEEFHAFWTNESTPPVVLVFLDGESPWGDSYQVNSEVSGPYADANFDEFFPWLANQFPIDDRPQTRFLTGCSTGGWVSMALQVLYPEYFNGAFSFSPDSPTFKAFQLVNLYEDENAYFNEFGMLRPSMRRSEDGEPMFGVRDEIYSERALGRDDNYLNSAQQWAVWNVVFGRADADGQPIPAWDQLSGEIDRDAVEGWARYDIDRHVRENWSRIGPDLAGKLHFWMGDMDEFYLNVGLGLFEHTLAELASPAPAAEFNWVRNRGHCDFDIQTFYVDVLDSIAGRIQQ